IRWIMESRLHTGLGDVRIRTGHAASALCREMGARAFTFGRDVVFGEGQYSPDSPAGRRLLAHELVHVLQQRSAHPGAESPFVPLGGTLDAYETEADRLAAQALGAGLQSSFTPDNTRSIRRNVEFDTHESGKHALIIPDYGSVRPRVEEY